MSPRPTRRMPSIRIQRQWVSILDPVRYPIQRRGCIARLQGLAYHELLELLVDPSVLPDPVVAGEMLEDAVVVGGKMTITVETPEVTVDSGGAMAFEVAPGFGVVDAV